jgi:hypothetical protein
VRDIFRARYGDRLVDTAPHSLDRRTPAAIQGALVDLLLLRATDAFVGTTGSTFSEFATFGRAVPFVRVWGTSPAFRWANRIARATGIEALVRGIVRVAHGQNLPLVAACNVLRSNLTRRLRWSAMCSIEPGSQQPARGDSESEATRIVR